MMLLEQMKMLVDDCSYKPGWIIRFERGPQSLSGYFDRPYIQIEVTEEAEASLDSSRTGKRVPWKSGKTYLSRHMCRQEIVSAVYGAIERAELHEIREWFRYRNASIFNPHLDPDVLAAVARKRENFNVRANAMSMEERNENQ